MRRTAQSFSSWTRLAEIDCDGLALSGTLPETLASWPLNVLSLAHTRLSGTLPPGFSVWPMNAFRIIDARVSGTIPPPFAAWGPTLNSFFILSSTRVSGTLPPSLFATWTQVDLLDISRSNLTGTLPDASNMSLLRILDISGTRLSGTLYGTGLGSLQYLFASQSRFAAVDNSLLTLPNLRKAKLDGNELAFSPSRCPPNITIDVLDLSRNPWQGVPATDALGCLVNGAGNSITHLYLDGMGLAGTIAQYSVSPKLRSLSLNGNRIRMFLMEQRFGHEYLSYKMTVWDKLSLAENLGPENLLDGFASYYIVSNINFSYTNASFCYDGEFFYNPQLEVAVLHGVRASSRCKTSVIEELLKAKFSHCVEQPPETDYVLPRVYCQLERKVPVAPPASACAHVSRLRAGLLP
jgi:hypothetical protein